MELRVALERDVKNKVSPKRYKHTIGVVETARKLALVYGQNPADAEIAALLHDILKEEDIKILRKYCQGRNGKLLNGYRKSKDILHAFAAAEYGKEKYGISDERILNAVRYHTIGRAKMEILEKIIYLSDCIEPGRDYPVVEKLRELSDSDLDGALLFEVKNKVKYLLENDIDIHPNSVKMRNYLLKKEKKKNGLLQGK